jgi:hypothetical protein
MKTQPDKAVEKDGPRATLAGFLRRALRSGKPLASAPAVADSAAAMPLRFPAHFPPTTPWKKFFIGVRWLGPDLSFFKELKRAQSCRQVDQMNAWGGGRRQAIAELIAGVLHRHLGWKTPVFLPEDSVAVAFYGPKFDLLDNFVVEEIAEAIEARFKIELPESFWIEAEEMTLGDLVEAIAAIGRA